jgi:murein L,D-transpeptidase YcbB/YkuD
MVCQRLLDLRPQHPSYRRLCAALERYRRYAQNGGWPQVEYVAKLEPGAYSPRIAQVQRRLAVTGEWSADGASGDTLTYDDRLVQAVKLFQKQHGLEADGVIGWSTVQEMNVTAAERCRQIEVNLERWRWLYRDLGEYYILVNIPTFELEVVEQDSIVMTMNVVVGKPARRTPVLSDVMTHVVLNPHWNVPVSIILQDMIPEIRRNPRYLSDRGIRIYPNWDINQKPVDPQSVDWNTLNKNNLPYLFRQDPGPENALGRVKFVLHNDFDVYLHDSPARGLFARSERAFSSGCIRVQDPLRLAEHLLAKQPSWNAEAISRALQSNREVTIVLPQPYNIHLQYWTAWINGDGQLRFARDIYLRDQLVADALSAHPQPERG